MTDSVSYNLVFPLAKKDVYQPNDTIDFIVSLENKKLVPGSLAISGSCLVGDTSNIDAPVAVPQGNSVQIDPDAGYHACFRDFTTEFRQVGITESFSHYPRYVKMKTQCTKFQDSLGTETYNCIEGKCPTMVVRQGYDLGKTAGPLGATREGAMPFVLKPDIAANKSNAPIPGNQVGTIRIRCRLAPSDEVIFGSDVASTDGYLLYNLRLHYESIPDDGQRPPLQMEVYNVNRQVIETNNANLATFVPGLADAVHMSFNSVANEQSSSENYLRCVALPGKPLRATGVAGPTGTVLDGTDPNNGAERLYYAINDTDTALVGFTMETRPEMTWNYLRSFNNEPVQYSVKDDRIDAPKSDAYGLGINFGAPIDFSQQKFAAQLDSQVNTPYSCYLYFRGLVSV